MPPSDGADKSKKLRSACDFCRQTKVKCTGGITCSGCSTLNITCVYSISNRMGRPRGAKNKKTLERIQQYQASVDRQQPPMGAMRPSVEHGAILDGRALPEDEEQLEADWTGADDEEISNQVLSYMGLQHSTVDELFDSATECDTPNMPESIDNMTASSHTIYSELDFTGSGIRRRSDNQSSISEPMASEYFSISKSISSSHPYDDRHFSSIHVDSVFPSPEIYPSGIHSGDPGPAATASDYFPSSSGSRVTTPSARTPQTAPSSRSDSTHGPRFSSSPAAQQSSSYVSFLHEQASLLSRVTSPTAGGLDSTLSGAQAALQAWNNFIDHESHSARPPGQHSLDVYFVIASSMRILIRSISAQYGELCRDQAVKADGGSCKSPDGASGQSLQAAQNQSWTLGGGRYTLTPTQDQLVTSTLLMNILGGVGAANERLCALTQSYAIEEQVDASRGGGVSVQSRTSSGQDIVHEMLRSFQRNLARLQVDIQSRLNAFAKQS